MRRILARLRREKGQGLIMFVAIFTVIMVAGAITVDLGLWLSERRGAQTDADLPALAGAYELLAMTDDPAIIPAAERAVYDWAEHNDLPGEDVHELVVDTSCWDDPSPIIDSVYVSVEHHSRTLFSSFFGVVAPEIGAHAKACVGSLRKSKGLQPWVVSLFNSPCFEWTDVDGDGVKDEPYNPDLYRPRFGEECVIRLESPSSQVGSIRLGDDPGDECNEPGGGAAKYKENIIEGSDAWCELGQLVDTEPGLNVGPTLQALEERLSTEGACDARYGQLGDSRVGIDDFPEVFTDSSGGLPTAEPSAGNVYFPRECDDEPTDEAGEPDSPRVVNIVILDEFDGTGMDTRPIRGFAGFFIYQCEELDKDGNIVLPVYPKCDPPPGAGANFQIRGTFIQYVQLGGEAGPPDPFGTSVIVLVE